MATLPPRLLSVLNDLHVMLYRMHGVHVSFQPPAGRLRRDPWDFGRPWICDCVRRIPGMLARCDASEARACRLAGRRPLVVRCHAGLEQFVVPIERRGRIVLHAVVSPLRTARPPAPIAARVHERVGDLGYDPETLAWAVDQLPVLDRAGRDEIARVIRSVAEAALVAPAAAATGYGMFHPPARAASAVPRPEPDAPPAPGGAEEWLSFLWAGFEPESDEPREGPWSRHRSHDVLVWAVRAPAVLIRPGGRFAVPRGSVAVIPSGERYRVEAAKDSPSPFWVHIVSSVDLSAAGFRPFAPGPGGRQILDRLAHAPANRGIFDASPEEKLRLLAWLVELSMWTARGAPRRGRPPETTVDEGVERARRLLEAGLARRVTLPELSRDAGVNVYTLIRRFRRVHGLAPLAWQRQERVRRAVAWLREGRRPKAVAGALGWRDVHAFGRAIRASTGRSPRALRPRAALN